MKTDFFTTLDIALPGFERKTPHKKDLLRGNVVLLLNEFDELFHIVDDFINRVHGIIVTRGESIKFKKAGKMLWYMTAPDSSFPILHSILSGYMKLFSSNEELFEENIMLNEEYKLLKNTIASTRKNYNVTNEKLRMKVEQGEILNKKLQSQVIQLTNLEQNLRESEKNLKQAQQIAKIGSWQWDFKNFIMSEEVKKIFCLQDDYVEKDIFQIIETVVYPDDRHKVNSFFKNLQTSVTTEGLFFRVTIDNNETRWIYLMSPQVKESDEKGNPKVYIGTIQDITQRKLVEDEIHHLRNLLSNIVNSMPSILVGVDREGRVIQWNRKAEEISGINEKKALGTPLELILPQLKGEMSKIFKAIESRQIQEKPKVIWNQKGENRFEDIIIYPLTANGVEGAVIRVDDVTDRVRLEEIMIQSEKMLSVGGLAAGMAHEINNPLAGIMQNISVVANRLSGDLPKNRVVAENLGVDINDLIRYVEKRDILRILENIKESGKRASRIVKNMLSFARMSSSKFTNNDIVYLMDQTLELANSDYNLKKKYDFRKIEIIKEYEAGLPKVSCEGSKIQQVFLNILKNGAEVMSQNRKNKAAHPRFIIRIFKEGKMMRIEVEDNGPGMSQEEAKRVFEPFFTTKPVGAGTGLGLSVSYFIITENHGGSMTVESATGKGTVFIIKIPIRK